MKLLNQTVAKARAKLENDALIDSNVRLRKYHQEITTKLNNVKDSYEGDKLEKLREFEQFCKDIQIKRTKVLEELANWQKLVADTKEIYYGFILRKDELQEKEYQIDEENKKLNLREAFVMDLEAKWQAKQ
jgi:hypothetical protein